MYISEFSRKIKVPTNVLRRWHSEGLLVPAGRYPRGDRYYSEEQVEKYKNGEYFIPEEKYLSAKQFSEETGLSFSRLTRWQDNGRLVPVYVKDNGHKYYSKEQVDKYFTGEYDYKNEEGFINRDDLAQLIGVSIHTLISWDKKDLLHPDHKSKTKVWLYTDEQVKEARNIKEKYKKNTLQKA